jgi:hypothetical protein
MPEPRGRKRRWSRNEGEVDEEIPQSASILPHVLCAPLIDIPGAGSSSGSSTSSKEQ